VLDIMGGKYLERNVKALKTDGRLVIIGLQGGRKAELDLGVVMAKRATITGTTLRARPKDEKTQIILGVLRDVWPRIESGEIRPVIDRRVPLSEAGRAHRLVASNEHVGKVLLPLA
jgi:NADPH:quinone reductase-like Zn-dependent oxidoreductase